MATVPKMISVRCGFVERDRGRRMKLIFRAFEDARLRGQADEAERLLQQWRAMAGIQKREARLHA